MNKSIFSKFNFLIIFIYFISGGCSLIYEVIWRRLLKLIIGNTTYATSITIAVFIGGLALGAFLVRNRADKIKNKIKVYGIIEGAISLFALLIPVFLWLVDFLYKTIYRTFSPPSAVILILQIFISSLILLIPAVLMGSTLPILSGWLIKKSELTGFKSGLLYSFNTLGALVGTYIAGFYLIRLIGIYYTYYIAVGLNFIIALSAFLISIIEKKKAETSKIKRIKIKMQKEKQKKSFIPIYVNIFLFINGFVALGYEILWMKTVVHYLKAEIYVFSAILTIYLFGYAIGSHIGSWITKKIKNYLFLFAIITQLIGLSGILYIPYLIQLPVFQATWLKPLGAFLLQQEGYYIHLLYSFLLFFIPSILMGLCFPLLIQMRAKYSENIGNTIASAYSINTAGCVFGSLIAAFLFIPIFGSQISIQIFGFIAIFAGLLIILLLSKLYQKIILVPIAVFSLLFFIFYPESEFIEWVNINEGQGQRQVQLLDIIEGINTTASVHQYVDDKTKVITTAGINVAGDSRLLRQTQKVQGHFPVILHGNPKKVLTVGFGSGELTKTLTFHNIPDISCVEIAPEMVVLSKKHFSHINLGDDLEKKVKMIYMDAKNYIHLTDTKYDVIMNDSIWPGYFAESSSLYTKEYFIDGKRILNDDGIYSTWLPINMPTLSLLSIVKTFYEVFENTLLFYPHNEFSQHILLVGQKNAHKYSYTNMKNEYMKENVINSLKLIGIEDINHVIDFILADYSSLKELTKAFPINSDYFPVVEFDVGRGKTNFDFFITQRQLKFFMDNTNRVDYSHLISFNDPDELEKEKILNDLYKSQQANDFLLKSYFPISLEVKRDLIRYALEIDPHNPDIIRQYDILSNSQ
ncbi:MAG: fused MFS/spermidine synthase [Spirochaetales bacterium]|nr:fused MFS/spermidine synthase [Spirochaetales bacterium]